ncbi:hypothetical protein BH11PSE6_BH11PSE6_25250 [soil metagenome]
MISTITLTATVGTMMLAGCATRKLPVDGSYATNRRAVSIATGNHGD